MNQNVDLLLIGDSLVFGYGVPRECSWCNLIKENNSSLIILNKGINGDTSSGILSRFYKDVLKYKPKNTFIMCGTNDLLSGRRVDYIVGNIEIMINDLLSINSNVIIGLPPIINKHLAENLFMSSNYYDHTETSLFQLHKELLALCEKYPLKYIDFYTLTKNNIYKQIFLDGIHFNVEGNKLFFNEASKILF